MRTDLPAYAASSARPRPTVRVPVERLWVALLAGGAAVILALALVGVTGGERSSAAGHLALLLATCGAGATLAVRARRPDAWVGTKLLAVALVAAAFVEILAWTVASGPPGRLAAAVVTAMLLLASLGALWVEFRDHVPAAERVGILADVALITVVCGVAVQLFVLRGSLSGTGLPLLLTLLLGASSVIVLAGWIVLTVWVPTRTHFGLLGCATLLGFAALILVRADPSTSLSDGQGSLLTALAALILGSLLVVEPWLVRAQPRLPVSRWWVRPALLGVSLCAACILLVAALVAPRSGLGTLDGAALTLVVTITVAMRIGMNQLEMVRAARKREEALAERETAMSSLRSVTEKVAASEARLRLVLDSAVDGIVELSADGRIMGANEAFVNIIRLPLEGVIGYTWTEVAGAAPGGGESLAKLPTTGEASVERDGQISYLEARSSALPSNPPGTVLLVRDVTDTKVPEQTIRTLFQFLQDKDEDRTRILKRTDAAIEAERNRIARDLHDGPIQGVAAATLSLEAVRLMIQKGDVQRASEMLLSVRNELSEETGNLRRLMSDLRPPVLEERGLIPAVHDLCDRWGRDLGTPVTVRAVADAQIPRDVETLAYRVIQEALSNISKHAGASNVWVRIEARYGTLYLEIGDDGKGFDPADAREFLHRGRVGLASMRERAELQGGTLVVHSEQDKGTTVIATLPFELAAAAQLAADAETA